MGGAAGHHFGIFGGHLGLQVVQAVSEARVASGMLT